MTTCRPNPCTETPFRKDLSPEQKFLGHLPKRRIAPNFGQELPRASLCLRRLAAVPLSSPPSSDTAARPVAAAGGGTVATTPRAACGSEAIHATVRARWLPSPAMLGVYVRANECVRMCAEEVRAARRLPPTRRARGNSPAATRATRIAQAARIPLPASVQANSATSFEDRVCPARLATSAAAATCHQKEGIPAL